MLPTTREKLSTVKTEASRCVRPEVLVGARFVRRVAGVDAKSRFAIRDMVNPTDGV